MKNAAYSNANVQKSRESENRAFLSQWAQREEMRRLQFIATFVEVSSQPFAVK